MSYEGTEEILCENGHHEAFDCYMAPNLNSWKCGVCGKKAVWWNAIDETNGIDEDTGVCPGTVELELVKDSNEPLTTCPTCKCNTYEIPVYKIPESGRRD